MNPASVWKRVVLADECAEDGACPVCKEDYAECECPGPTMENYEYKEINGVLLGRPLDALTEIEKEIWALYQRGRRRKEILRALDLGFSERTLDRFMRRIREKLGLRPSRFAYAQPEGPRPSVKEIIKEEARAHAMTVAQFLAPSRERKLVRLRQLAMYRARVETRRSYPEIARAFGIDHTTVMYAVKRIAEEFGEKV